MKLPIARIEPGTRLRGVCEEQVASLADSITKVGLLSPITVYSRKAIEGGIAVDGWGLVAGLHRLEAHKRLGFAEIEALVVELPELKRQLAECDENLCGTKLTPSERSLFTRRRKQIYEALHPETRNGATGRNHDRTQLRQSGKAEPDRFTADTAARTGTSERTVQRDAHRGERIAEDVLREIAGTKLDKGVVLDELARTEPEKQAEKLRQIAEQPQPAKTGVTIHRGADADTPASGAGMPRLQALLVDYYRSLITENTDLDLHGTPEEEAKLNLRELQDLLYNWANEIGLPDDRDRLGARIYAAFDALAPIPTREEMAHRAEAKEAALKKFRGEQRAQRKAGGGV